MTAHINLGLSASGIKEQICVINRFILILCYEYTQDTDFGSADSIMGLVFYISVAARGCHTQEYSCSGGVGIAYHLPDAEALRLHQIT